MPAKLIAALSIRTSRHMQGSSSRVSSLFFLIEMPIYALLLLEAFYFPVLTRSFRSDCKSGIYN